MKNIYPFTFRQSNFSNLQPSPRPHSLRLDPVQSRKGTKFRFSYPTPLYAISKLPWELK
uniref:Uncharacterized protein n=1 Tax=Arundo donax TaxID=35708 RepID=A0A0A9HSY7_ARUDO